MNIQIIKDAIKRASKSQGKDYNWILLNEADYAAFMRSVDRPEWSLGHQVDGITILCSESVEAGSFGAMAIHPIPSETCLD
jgi:hypothetical protein